MAEVTNELILEPVKRIQIKLSDQDGRFDGISARLGRIGMTGASMQRQLGVFAETDAHLQAQVDQLRREVDRINRRLELHDPIG